MIRDRFERIPGGGPPRIIAYGATLFELFEHAAVGMFSIGYDLDGVAPRHSRPVVAPGDRLAELLVNWLRELLAESNESGIVFSYFTVDRLEEGGVQGSAAGLPFGEVVRRQTVVSDVEDDAISIIEIPDGYWVELGFRVQGLLRPT